MILSKNRRGRPAGKTIGEPKSSTERTRAYRDKLRKAGGASITLALEEKELALLDSLKQDWSFPENVTNSELVRAMIVVLSGHSYISSGCNIKAKVKITRR